MDQDTPDLFDSEPVSVNLTVAKSNTEVNTDDILAEIIEEIDDTRASNVDNNEADDQVQEEPMEEFHTDESDIENEDGDTINIQLNGDGVDESVDQSTELQGEEPTKTKAVHKGLPPGRVKLIMKMDPDVHLVASDAVFILTKATENFVGLLAKHCHKSMVASNKKTLQKKHIDAVIEESVPFEFLDGALDW